MTEIYTEADWKSDLTAAGVTDLVAVLRERAGLATAAEAVTCGIGACPNPALPDRPFCGECERAIYFGDDHAFSDCDLP